MARNGCRGFSLIELMIVLAIASILAAIAIPGYQKQVLRAKRADGKAYILDLASREERFYTQYATYTGVIEAPSGCSAEACGLGMADTYSSENHYTSSVACLPAGACTTYTLTVTPSGFTDDKCLTLTYTSNGVKGFSGTGSVEECWR
ncbi:type IV pilin protein [Teredinibacter turnerae]|uniref:type IV pilin protein n=1 Tax=Teredinibacter turnerae TaxID=2426 RepID=UPI0009B79A3D|nr:type IV pilin protein [Teredinibacter turnerae]